MRTLFYLSMAAIALPVFALIVSIGTIPKIIFHAAAEAIRLMKKQNGIGYSGRITEPSKDYSCEGCKETYDVPVKACNKCGAVFETQ